MSSIYKNIDHFQSRTRSSTWGKQSWEKIVVCIVADGRQKCHKRVLNFLGLMGAYQDGIAKDEVLGQPVQAHVYEYTTQVHVAKGGQVSGGVCPVQICFILKEKNAKKLNSHRWFFNAVCEQLNPNVVALIDVGTRPSGTSLYHLWKEFDKHKNIVRSCSVFLLQGFPRRRRLMWVNLFFRVAHVVKLLWILDAAASMFLTLW